MKILVFAAAAAAFVPLQQAQAQDANAMFARQNQEMERAIAEAQGRMVAGNIRDPRVVEMFYQAQRQGYRGSLEQFAFGYGATGGYTDQGRRVWVENEARNRANEVGAVQRLRGATRELGDAVAERNGHAAQNQYDAGLSMQGRQRYYDPAAGMQTERSYGARGDNGYDPRTGRSYRQDARGNYYSCGPDGCVYVAPAR